MLSFAQLRQANKTRCVRWHKGGIEEWSASDWAVAMFGEAGEACNAIKKLIRVRLGAANINEPGRQLSTEAEAIAAIWEELADTLCYIDLLAIRLGINLEHEVRKKFNAVSEKYGFPERL